MLWYYSHVINCNKRNWKSPSSSKCVTSQKVDLNKYQMSNPIAELFFPLIQNLQPLSTPNKLLFFLIGVIVGHQKQKRTEEENQKKETKHEFWKTESGHGVGPKWIAHHAGLPSLPPPQIPQPPAHHRHWLRKQRQESLGRKNYAGPKILEWKSQNIIVLSLFL